MGEQHVSLQIDENNNVTKVGISATQLELFPTPVFTDIYEQCILCGVETTTLKTTHIDYRTGYIEGAGQLCRECYMKSDRNLLTIDERTIIDTPNDMELGKKVRKLYWENKK